MLRKVLPTQVRNLVLVFAFVLLPFLTGCGNEKFPVRPAKGKVVFNGSPVTVGSVTFSPVGDVGTLEVGKSATGAVGADGTFVLTTTDRFDGAIVGKHNVQYVGPEDEEGTEEGTEESESSTGSAAGDRAQNAKRIRDRAMQRKMQFVLKGETVVEVKADGDNDFTIEVVLRGNSD